VVESLFDKPYDMTRFVRTWTDEQLTKAVAETHAWRAATRALGMGFTSSYELVRRRAVELSLDTSHFEANALGPMKRSRRR
jgi:hypothetical protein